jgi:catechol-2,3-dioxygenase
MDVFPAAKPLRTRGPILAHSLPRPQGRTEILHLNPNAHTVVVSATSCVSAGLFQLAINYPTQRTLAAAVRRLYDRGWQIDGAQDHTTHEAIYLHDPDLNGLELACDRDPTFWSLMLNPPPDAWRTMNKPIDFDSLMGELGSPEESGVARYLPMPRASR